MHGDVRGSNTGAATTAPMRKSLNKVAPKSISSEENAKSKEGNGLRGQKGGLQKEGEGTTVMVQTADSLKSSCQLERLPIAVVLRAPTTTTFPRSLTCVWQLQSLSFTTLCKFRRVAVCNDATLSTVAQVLAAHSLRSVDGEY